MRLHLAERVFDRVEEGCRVMKEVLAVLAQRVLGQRGEGVFQLGLSGGVSRPLFFDPTPGIGQLSRQAGAIGDLALPHDERDDGHHGESEHEGEGSGHGRW